MAKLFLASKCVKINWKKCDCTLASNRYNLMVKMFVQCLTLFFVLFRTATGVSSSRTELFVRYEGVSFTNRFFSSSMIVFCINRAQYGLFLLGMFVFVCKSFMLHYHFIIASLNAHDLCLLVSMTMRAMQWYYCESFTINFFLEQYHIN